MDAAVSPRLQFEDVELPDDLSTSQSVDILAIHATFFKAFSWLAMPIVIIALFSNGLAFYIFYKKPAFRKILSNKLVMNLMIINIVSCVLLFPVLFVDMRMTVSDFESQNSSLIYLNNVTLPGETAMSSLALCILNSVLSSLVAHGSILAMLSIGVDQYMAILDPLEYPFKATRVVSWQMISLVWTLSVVSSVGTAFQMVTSARLSPWSSCRRSNGLVFDMSQSSSGGNPWLYNHTWLAVVSFVLYCFPVLALAFMYLRIFWAARRNSRDIRRNSFHLTLPSDLGDHEEERMKMNHKDDESKQSDRSDDQNQTPTPSKTPSPSPALELQTGLNSAPSSEKASPQSPVKKDLKISNHISTTSSEVFLINAPAPKRAPKLGALRASSTGSFSRPLVMTSVDVGALEDDLNGHEANGLMPGGGSGGLLHRSARLERRVIVTPKRKCSFSSFSECRLVADGGKTRTFLFSMEAPSTSPPPPPEAPDNPSRATSLDITASERRRQFSLGCNIERQQTASSSTGQFVTPQIQLQPPDSIDISIPSEVYGNSPDDSESRNGMPKIRRKSAEQTDTNGSSPKLSHKSGSLISMTSQAARRLSCTVSRRASSVYQFFHYREELRTAKITALVIVIAFVCWGPFFLLLLYLPMITHGAVRNANSTNATFQGLYASFDSESGLATLFWLHFTSAIMGLSFAATSPYVYVFRSEKVQKCLKQILSDTFCCCRTDIHTPGLTSKLASRAGSISCMQPHYNPNPSTINPMNHNFAVPNGQKLQSPTPSAKRLTLRPTDILQQDHRSHSCPDLDIEKQDDGKMRDDYFPNRPSESGLHIKALPHPSAIVVSTLQCSNHFDSNRSKDDFLLPKRLNSPSFLAVPMGKYCRTLGRKHIPCTRSNLEIEDDILEEEEEESFLNEYNFEHRRLSASLPFGLNLIDRPPLETTV